MDWKIGLDKYLTQEPCDNGYEDYFEDVVESFTDLFYNTNESWIIDETEQIDRWVNKLFYKHEPKYSAKIIERAFKIYKL